MMTRFWNSNKRGQWAEQQAERYLREHGLKFIMRNYHCRHGEIDLIMQEQNTLIFVEVRYRKQHTYGGALESIDTRKQQKIQATAMHYLQKHDPHSEHGCRFDALLLAQASQDNHSSPTASPSINWIKNAF